MNKKKPVQHFIDGKNSWKQGFFGCLSRYRGFITAILINLLGGGWISYICFFGSKIGNYNQIKSISITLYIFASFFALIGLLYYNRTKSIKVSKHTWQLHQIAHELRDVLSKAEDLAKKAAKLSRNDTINFLRIDFGKTVCNHIREFFRISLGNEVECALRLANRTDNSKPFFCTIGRSDGLNKRRSNEYHVPADEGIPKFFLNSKQKCIGVLVYHDIDKATAEGLYYKTQNDFSFKSEIRALIVAPINGWDGEKISMLGLLYITSREDVFSRKQADSLKMLADMLGMTISRIIYCLYAEKKVLINVKNGGTK